MPRRILALALLFGLLALPALATTSRVRALGGQPDFLEDESGVLTWYGSLVDYPQLALLEAGDLDHQAGGSFFDKIAHTGGALHYRFDRAGKWGTAAIHFGSDLPAPDSGGWVQLVYARRCGPVALGATFRGTSQSEAAAEPGAELSGISRFVHNLGLGARWDLRDNLYCDLAVEALDTEVDYFHDERGLTVEDQGGWNSAGVRARVFHGLGPTVAAVYRLDWFRDVRPIVDDYFDDLVDMDAASFRGGLGFDILPDPENLILASVDYHRHQEDRDARHPFYARWEQGWRLWWRLEVRAGVESRVLPWLTVRGSARYQRTVDESLAYYDWSDGYQEQDYDYAVRVRTPVTLGLGLHLGRFDADLVFNDSAPWNVTPNLPADAGADQGHHSALTVKYRW